MKAIFIYRDGKLFGSPGGYTTEKGARKSLVGCEDWYRELRPYTMLNASKDLSKEMKTTGFYEWSDYTHCWLFKREKWSRKIWNDYVKKHYNFVEEDFEIKHQ